MEGLRDRACRATADLPAGDPEFLMSDLGNLACTSWRLLAAAHQCGCWIGIALPRRALDVAPRLFQQAVHLARLRGIALRGLVFENEDVVLHADANMSAEDGGLHWELASADAEPLRLGADR